MQAQVFNEHFLDLLMPARVLDDPSIFT